MTCPPIEATVAAACEAKFPVAEGGEAGRGLGTTRGGF